MSGAIVRAGVFVLHPQTQYLAASFSVPHLGR